MLTPTIKCTVNLSYVFFVASANGCFFNHIKLKSVYPRHTQIDPILLRGDS